MVPCRDKITTSAERPPPRDDDYGGDDTKQKKPPLIERFFLIGSEGGIRTPDTRIMIPLLEPTELLRHR